MNNVLINYAKNHLNCYPIELIIATLQNEIIDRTDQFVIFWDLKPTRTNWLTGQLYFSQATLNTKLKRLRKEFPKYQMAFDRLETTLQQHPTKIII